MRIPVIIDTDPGLDDSIALLVAFASEELDIKAITTVAGNQTLEKTTENAAKIIELAKFNTKLAAGADKPIKRDQVVAAEVHGESGMGSVKLPKSKVSISSDKAYKVIYEEAVKLDGELEIIALGPLTNIANAIMLYPDIKKLIKRIVIMGGGHAFGNVTPAAEFNIYADAEAAKLVFESGIPMVMVGLDATHQAFIVEEQIDSFFDKETPKVKIIKQLLQDIMDCGKEMDLKVGHMHDLLAVIATFEPKVITGDYYHVDIETKGSITYGKTAVDLYNRTNKDKNVYVAFHADRELFLDIMKKRLMSYQN